MKTNEFFEDEEAEEGTHELKEADKEYNYEKDSQGRNVKASGHLYIEKGERDLEAQRNAGGEYRRENDDGGHLIATRFNGSGGNENIVAEDKHLNRGGFKSLENHWADELEGGKDVYVEVNAYYGGESTRPEAILVKEEISEGNDTQTDYYSFTNENLETEEFELPPEAEMDDFDEIEDGDEVLEEAEITQEEEDIVENEEMAIEDLPEEETEEETEEKDI